jgi:chromosome segregation ATPase
MMQFCCLLLGLFFLPATVSLAQIYRWTDDAGRVHFTNNPETIPADRRPYSRQITSGPSATPPPSDVAPAASLPSTLPSGSSQSEPSAPTADIQRRIHALEQQIAALRQERQQILDQLKTVRPIRMNPAFGQERRHVDHLGRTLATVEQQLDTLYAELQQLSRQQSAVTADTSITPPTEEVILDKQGHDQSYWRQRFQTLQERLQQARQQRQAILTELAGELSEERGAFGRRGREVLQLVNILEQLDQEIHETETALQALRREAMYAGAPAQWLQ